MNRDYRTAERKTILTVSLGLGLAGCAYTGTEEGTANETAAIGEEALIADVEAKSAALDSVGALVWIHRRTTSQDFSQSEAPKCRLGTDEPSIAAGATASNPGSTEKQTHQTSAAYLNLLHQACAESRRSKRTKTCGSEPVGGIEYTPFCTGTLIGKTAVLTAKHCLLDLELASEGQIGFAIGPDAYHPKAVYPIVDWDWETAVPADPNALLQGLGSDVGIAHLGKGVTGVVPTPFGTLKRCDVGNRYTAMGYDLQDDMAGRSTRKAGSLTLRGMGGNYADYAFGGLAGFLKVGPTMPAFVGLSELELTEYYSQLGLIANYQAFFGGKPGDDQPCTGDSGGPIVGTRNGNRTVFGIVTNAFGSNRRACDYGVVAAIFGPLTYSYLRESLKWVDPCTGETSKGRCDGDLAVRCTTRAEGERRLSETDCSLLGQTCGFDETGTVACVDLAP